MKKSKKMLAILLTSCLFTAILPMKAMAEPQDQQEMEQKEVNIENKGDAVQAELSVANTGEPAAYSVSSNQWVYDGTSKTLTNVGGSGIVLNNVIPNGDGANTLTIGDNQTFSGTLDLSGEITDSNSGNYTITQIEWSAFFKSELTSVTIPSSVKEIGKSAFRQCTSLTEVNLSRATSLTTIGDNAFLGSGLTSVTIPSSVKEIGKNAFRQCTSLTEVNLSSATSLTTIGDDAFLGSGLTNIAIPANVTQIVAGVFRDCKNLIEVDLSKAISLTTIGEFAFQESGLTKVTIPSSVKEIGMIAFGSCTSLTEVDLSSATSLITIGEFAFFESGITSLAIPENVTQIAGAFRGCEYLKKVDLSHALNLATIGELAFLGSGLTNIVIPPSVKTIDETAFGSCTDLTTIDLSSASGLKTIGTNAFLQSGLTSVDLSGATSLTTIGYGAFAESELENVILPATVTTIEQVAFADCKELKYVIFASAAPPTLANNTFKNVPDTLVLWHPSGKAWDSFTFSPYTVKTLNADISSLAIENGVLKPAFSSQVTTYNIEFDNFNGSITFTAQTAAPNSLLTVNGQSVQNGQPYTLSGLTHGSKIDITVTNKPEKAEKHYILTAIDLNHPKTTLVSPKTGDSSNVLLWFISAIIAAGAAAAAVYLRKRRI